MSLLGADYAILAVLDEQGGFLTRKITVDIHGNGNLRRDSAMMYRRLYSLSQSGYVRELDNLKPICWCRTPKGTEALAKWNQTRTTS